MIELHNRTLNFTCDPATGAFTLLPVDETLPALLNAHLAIRYRAQGLPKELLNGPWPVSNVVELPRNPSLLGLLSQVDVQLAANTNGIACRLTFALSDLFPMLLWKIRIENNGPEPFLLDRIEMLRCKGGQNNGLFRLSIDRTKISSPAFFANNWQSWGWTGAYGVDQAAMRSRLGPFQNPMVINPGTPQHRAAGAYSSDFFGVIGDRARRVAALFGFLSQRCQYGTLDARIQGPMEVSLWANCDQVRVDPGGAMETDWAVYFPFNIDQIDPLGPYFIAASRENRVSLPEKIPSGWCSWYQFYTKVSADQIRQNLQSIQQLSPYLPIDLIQIDDGFEAQVGDWFDFRPGFPKGVVPLAAEIHAAGYTPGLWLAPFIVHPAAELMDRHPEFILRNRLGKPVNAGFVWDRFTTALDLTHPGALEHACKIIETARRQWGFSYLKLDFLYAGALGGPRPPPRPYPDTRSNITRRDGSHTQGRRFGYLSPRLRRAVGFGTGPGR